MIFIELSILTLLVICSIFYIWETVTDIGEYITKDRSVVEKYFIYGLVGFIALSMLMELAKVLYELFSLIREKCRKKSPEELQKIENKKNMSHEDLMKKYWKNCKVWTSSAKGIQEAEA